MLDWTRRKDGSGERYIYDAISRSLMNLEAILLTTSTSRVFLLET